MMNEQSNLSGVSRPSQKLVLPAPNAAYAPTPAHQQTQHGYAPPEYFLHSKQIPAIPVYPLPKQKKNWRKDPAYIVLLVGICMVLFGGVAFATVANNMFFASTAQTVTTAPTDPKGTGSGNMGVPTPQTNPGGAVNTTPTQVPTAVPTATPVQVTPTAVPTAPPVQPTPVQGQAGPLQVTLDNPPARVMNNSIVPITATTNAPNTNVRLVITYNTFPFFITVGPQLTDANGTVTLPWNVAVRASGRNMITTAHIVIVGRDQNNKQATSQIATVQIITRGIME